MGSSLPPGTRGQNAFRRDVELQKLKYYFFFVDIGFIAYWLITLLEIVPNEYLFNDYANPILVAWNWSFLPLDLLVSATGLTSIYLWKSNDQKWIPLALISLVLTSCSGLQAIAFWTIRADFDVAWWLPNLFLLLYPLCFIKSVSLRYLAILETQS